MTTRVLKEPTCHSVWHSCFSTTLTLSAATQIFPSQTSAHKPKIFFWTSKQFSTKCLEPHLDHWGLSNTSNPTIIFDSLEAVVAKAVGVYFTGPASPDRLARARLLFSCMYGMWIRYLALFWGRQVWCCLGESGDIVAGFSFFFVNFCCISYNPFFLVCFHFFALLFLSSFSLLFLTFVLNFLIFSLHLFFSFCPPGTFFALPELFYKLLTNFV